MSDDPNDPRIRRRTAADMWPDPWWRRLWAFMVRTAADIVDGYRRFMP